jgi:hypothetical protein
MLSTNEEDRARQLGDTRCGGKLWKWNADRDVGGARGNYEE